MIVTTAAKLGDKLDEAKDDVPTRPHPRVRDTPPADAAAGLLADRSESLG